MACARLFAAKVESDNGLVLAGICSRCNPNRSEFFGRTTSVRILRKSCAPSAEDAVYFLSCLGRAVLSHADVSGLGSATQQPLSLASSRMPRGGVSPVVRGEVRSAPVVFGGLGGSNLSLAIRSFRPSTLDLTRRQPNQWNVQSHGDTGDGPDQEKRVHFLQKNRRLWASRQILRASWKNCPGAR